MKLNLSTFTKTIIIILGLAVITIAYKKAPSKEVINKKENIMTKKTYFKLSLAEWSVHNAIMDKKLDPIDFAKKAKTMGFEAVEYVSMLYLDYLKKGNDPKLAMKNLLNSLKKESEKHDVKNLGIMVDIEGNLASSNEKERLKAVENHKKWIDAGAFLGCYYVRVNLFGNEENPKEWVGQSTKSLRELAIYAKNKGIDVIVENHGYLSSNTPYLVQVMKNVNMPNCGVLPDFGNFCLKREGGKLWFAKCLKEYDRYKGVEGMMPYAKAVSAKSYDFDAKGDETLIDYYKMLQIVKDGGYKGFIGIEYEGTRLSEDEGIEATKKLVLKAESQLK